MPVINTNLNALSAQESSRSSGLAMSQAMERLSTGKKINSAKDDAAGLSISNRMTSQIRGMAKAIQNSNDAISMTQTAEGAYGNVSDILQRMRELAVQAASGTNSDSDRTSLQLEVKQLQQLIDTIATNTNHNNIKLLDGSATNVVIQTDVKAGNTMALSFDSVKTKDIGVGSRATLMSSGGTAATTAALAAGSLLINGVSVGASVAVDDSASTDSAAGSAIAKVAAINKVSQLSGVYAKVEANSVSGASMSATATATVGNFVINGVTTDSFTLTDTATTRKNAIAVINAKSAQTGVVAIDTGDDNLGITLSAADGRNIVVGTFGGQATSANTGVRIAGTFTGAFSLYTLDNRDITIDTVSGSNGAAAITSSGLKVGTYKSNTATTVTYSRNGTTDLTGNVSVAAVGAMGGLLDSASLVLNGVAITAAATTDDTASDTTATSSIRSASAIAIAAAINKSSSATGVTATVNANIIRGQTFTANAVSSAVLFVNGTSITVNTDTRNGVIDSLNAAAAQTGVVASAFGDGVQLIAADGRNISLASTKSAAIFGLSGVGITTATAALATTYYSTVSLSSDKKFTVAAGKTGVTNLEALGFRQGTFGGSDNGQKINQVDVSSVSGASQALVAIDAAIETVSRSQSKSGALNNRLDAVINNLTESSSNMQASRSRIMDTDYAYETTALAKQLIISQAATAMLAQANQQGQSVLSLLK